MATINESVFAAALVALLDATAAGSRVERDRADAVGEDECPAIVLLDGGEDIDPFGGDVEKVRLRMEAKIFTRGADWATEADAIKQQIIAQLQASAELKALGVAMVRALPVSSDTDAAENQPGVMTAPIEFTFLRRVSTLGAVT
jgi:hypothetical protein